LRRGRRVVRRGREKPPTTLIVTLRLITEVPAGLPEPRDRSLGELDPAAFEELFLHAGGMLAILDHEGRFLAVNPASERVLGWDPQTFVGESLLDFLHPHDGSSALRARERAATAERGQREPDEHGRVVELLARHRHRDGSWRWLLWSGAAHGDRWYAAARDVTEWIQLEHRVGRDPLTRLPNREVLTTELTHALSRHARSNQHLAVLFLDIDSFKQINDSIGHEAGDRLLAQVAERLSASVRGGDVVGRLGGDEFAVVAESLGTEVDAAMIAQRALAAFSEPFQLGSGPIVVSASIGVTTGSGDGRTAGALLHEADIAMYRAKKAGGNRFAIFDGALRTEVELRLEAQRELHAALARGEFELYYQPIVTLKDSAVVGYEALLRWAHPERGVIAPLAFVPLAEQAELIVPLGLWALGSAAAQTVAWRASTAGLEISLNVSARQLAADTFPDDVKAALEQSGLSPGGLCLEITEAAMLVDPARTASVIAQLRELGVKIALDGFGAEPASLHQLIAVPLDMIKLDRGLIAALADADNTANRTSRAMLAAVTAAAHELRISVVAVGVEHERQREMLLSAGCELAQGHLFAPARPAAEVSLKPQQLQAQAHVHEKPASRRPRARSGARQTAS
jgi:diguanylate cyclase (GGDEF)-like protein/PAS domain S-box-containing protein